MYECVQYTSAAYIVDQLAARFPVWECEWWRVSERSSVFILHSHPDILLRLEKCVQLTNPPTTLRWRPSATTHRYTFGTIGPARPRLNRAVVSDTLELEDLYVLRGQCSLPTHWIGAVVHTHFSFFGENLGFSLPGCGSIANSIKSQFSIIQALLPTTFQIEKLCK